MKLTTKKECCVSHDVFLDLQQYSPPFQRQSPPTYPPDNKTQHTPPPNTNQSKHTTPGTASPGNLGSLFYAFETARLAAVGLGIDVGVVPKVDRISDGTAPRAARGPDRGAAPGFEVCHTERTKRRSCVSDGSNPPRFPNSTAATADPGDSGGRARPVFECRSGFRVNRALPGYRGYECPTLVRISGLRLQ